MQNKIEEIHRACRLGDIHLLQESLRVNPSLINSTDGKLGWTGLYRSVICDNTEAVECLLNKGANPNIKTTTGDTALHQAVDNSKLEIASLLLKYKADPDAQQNDGETPLHLACFKGDLSMVHLLLSYNANPNIQSNLFNKTPLHIASDYSYPDIIKLLLKQGASIEIEDKHGKTAKDIARNQEIAALYSKTVPGSPCPEPSDMPLKISNDNMSPANDSDVSFTSDLKTVNKELKQLEDIHKKIRDKVRTSVDVSRSNFYSQNTSSLFEPDAERAACEINRKTDKPLTQLDLNTDLYKWLKGKKLDEVYSTLVAEGYDDLQQIKQQMRSKIPITESTLAEIGINKPGYRKRLIVALENLSGGECEKSNKKLSPFQCCTAEINSNLLMLNLPDLEKWLESLNLKDLYPVFNENGYNELDQLIQIMNSPYEVTAKDLSDIGITKPGYRHRILSKLKEDSWGLGKKKLEEAEDRDSCRVM